MTAAAESLPADLAGAHTMILAERAARIEAQAKLAEARAEAANARADLTSTEALIAHLKRHQILSVFHYVPLHLSPMGQQFGGRKGDCPVTESVSDRLLRLPFYCDLDESDQERIVATTMSFQS